DRATRLDDRDDPRLGRRLDSVWEREVGVRGHDRELRPVARPPQRDLDRDLAARLTGADAHGRGSAGEDDRVRTDVADSPPREEEVGELLEGRAALRDDL